jgi:hypothetical protein
MTNSQRTRLKEAVRGHLKRRMTESLITEDVVDGMLKHIFGIIKKSKKDYKDNKLASFSKKLQKDLPDVVKQAIEQAKKDAAKKRKQRA